MRRINAILIVVLAMLGHRVAANDNATIAIVSIDNRTSEQVTCTPNGDGSCSLQYDAASLTLGFHTLTLQLLHKGELTNYCEKLFYRGQTQSEKSSMKIYYIIDGIVYGNMPALSESEHQTIEIDVAKLPEGLHRIALLCVGEDGHATNTESAFFYKGIPDDNGIIEYSWWINDEIADRVTTKLEKPTTPVSFASMIDVKSYPINTRRFNLTVGDDELILNPLNTFNLSYVDQTGHIGYNSRDYVDINVETKVPLSEITKLVSGDKKTINKIGKGDIVWYTFDAHAGDLATIVSDLECEIDIFTSSGELLHKIGESNSLTGGETRINDEGAYYVAVHDASKSKSFNIEFSLTDRSAMPGKPYASCGISGYWSESDTEFIGLSVDSLEYKISFENDMLLSTAPVNCVLITDTLDTSIFNIATVEFREIKCGTLHINVDGQSSVEKKIDLRPLIDCIVEATTATDPQTGIITCQLQCLDPLTSEPCNRTDHAILPKNDESGCGTGYVRFSVKLRDDVPHGATVVNKAYITFDNNNPVGTSSWENTTDFIKPTSRVTEAVYENDGHAIVKIEASDEGSGIWKHVLCYREIDSDTWTEIPIEDFYLGISIPINPKKGYALYTSITDYAGNEGEIDDNSIYTIESYESTLSGTIQIGSDAIKVLSGSQWIDFADAPSGTIVYVYGSDGLLRYHGNPRRIELPTGVYIVRVSDKAVKVRI